MNRVLIAGVILMVQIGCERSSSKSTEKEIPSREDYTLLKSHFYQDDKGNLFERKYFALESSDEERKHFYDSMMFYGEYPNQIALKKIVDIETFKELQNSPFSLDKNNVYYVQNTSDGHKRFIVENANPETFSALEYRWGKDDSHIFWESEIVEGADLESFQINDTSSNSAMDTNSAYVNGQKIE